MPVEVAPLPPAPTPETPEAATDDEKLSPAERYEKMLARNEIDRNYASGVVDAILSKGYFEEYVHIRGKRATFRTRTYDDHLRLQSALEFEKPTLALSQDDLITRYNLAASLCEWNGKKYPHDSDKDFETIMADIRKLPLPVFSMLARELSKFDAKMMLIFSEGAPDSF